MDPGSALLLSVALGKLPRNLRRRLLSVYVALLGVSLCVTSFPPCVPLPQELDGISL